MANDIHSIVNPPGLLQASPNIETFLVPGLFPDGQTVTLNHDLCILTVLAHPCEVSAQVLFTSFEYAFVRVLFEQFPNYCPFEVLVAAHFFHDVEAARAQVLDAYESGAEAYEHLMRPIRNRMSRARLKLEAIGVGVNILQETGYVLVPGSLLLRRHGNRRSLEAS